VEKGKKHCARGDVFQIVLSRKFEQSFQGDEFSVYRALRSINPSPYLFYYDFLEYKLFGSSPEAQLKIEDGVATINPIAGTIPRSGNRLNDEMLSNALLGDPKENSEHAMLVDLARNDLSRHSRNVSVSSYREVHAYSHVIHLVSTVTGKLNGNMQAYRVFADTFPAGTLSGAPKHRALQLIDSIEPEGRGFYGGALGFIGLRGTLNHAIMIRSFASYRGKLVYQAGAGIVIDSVPEKELREVKSKLSALRKALKIAETIK
jgi:anthranilate synthase component I